MTTNESKIRFGAIILTAFTLPLALCYPNPVPSQGGTSEIVAWRRLTCTSPLHAFSQAPTPPHTHHPLHPLSIPIPAPRPLERLHMAIS